MPIIFVVQGKARLKPSLKKGVTEFRVNGRRIVFAGIVMLQNDDHVTVAGVDSPGRFQAWAFRNDTTGTHATPRQRSMAALGVVAVAAMLAAIALGQGIGGDLVMFAIAFAILGMGSTRHANMVRRAEAALAKRPRPSIDAESA